MSPSEDDVSWARAHARSGEYLLSLVPVARRPAGDHRGVACTEAEVASRRGAHHEVDLVAHHGQSYALDSLAGVEILAHVPPQDW